MFWLIGHWAPVLFSIFNGSGLFVHFSNDIFAILILRFIAAPDMRLFEYQAKELFKGYGIPIPKSVRADDILAVVDAFSKLKHPVALKAQVLAGGRGKAGGISIVDDPTKAEQEAQRIFALSIGGEKPSAILVEEAYPHDSEMYLSITLDRGDRAFVTIAALAGGIDVESMSAKVIRKIPLDGIDKNFAAEVASLLSLNGAQAEPFGKMLLSLERLAREKECELAEINPVAAGKDGTLMALDAKIIVDDNALFRHPEFAKLHPEDEFEGEASRQGFAFVRLGGDIAVVGNGAGLVLSTLDLVGDAGGNPACFLDLGGGAQQDRIEAALRLVNRLPEVDRILINIYGGITRTTDVAAGIKTVLAGGSVKPVYARVSGAEEAEARKLLEGTPVKLFSSAPDAVAAVVKGQ
ncbi:MAG: acetate--CoA ligase family protein [Thaumarchaeota archaeon]|nr:acetate--CoA ligase family protein [Nitrososphaerota archaeon]